MEAEVKRLARRGLTDWADPRPKRVDTQTLVYPFTPDLAWLAVNYLRTPSRVLWDVFATDAARLDPLYEDVCDWAQSELLEWLPDDAGISVRAKQVRDFPASASQIQGTVKNAVVDGRRVRGQHVQLETENPDVLLSVRGDEGGLTISVDLGGRSLHERGYRLNRTQAPLRENLAAQILMLARWDARRETLIDPMCGSGTFPIEAASMARAAPLWVGGRKSAAASMPLYSGRETPVLFDDTRPTIIANDLHTPAIDATRENAVRAGMQDHLLMLHGHFEDLTIERMTRAARKDPPPHWPDEPSFEQGLIVCNPPYGERLETDLEELYFGLRDWAEGFGSGWRAAFLVADRDMIDIFGRPPRLEKPMHNGPIRSRLLVFDL